MTKLKPAKEPGKKNARTRRIDSGKSWLRQNADAIVNYNKFVKENGVFSEGIRSF